MSGRHMIFNASVEDILPALDPESYDACLCDPPYGLKFMSKHWDHGVPSAEIWKEVYRVLKPGAFLMAFGGTRTFHRLTCAIEDAGFEIRDCLMWLHGQGFPKSLDISKAIDKENGDEREVIGSRPIAYSDSNCWGIPNKSGIGNDHSMFGVGKVQEGGTREVTSPGSYASARWSGYGTALKPAWEPIILAMKPCSGTFAQNALEHGVAGLNIDECRIPGEVPSVPQPDFKSSDGKTSMGLDANRRIGGVMSIAIGGRWPANLILSHTPWCVEVNNTPECHPLCPIRLLDEQTGSVRSSGLYKPQGTDLRTGRGIDFGGTGKPTTMYSDSGGASRFFYAAKVSTTERNLGGIDCKHPTLKPIPLARYLATLLLPPSREPSPRSILVPFSGAGSEIIGCLAAGWDVVDGIELEPEYVQWAESRIAAILPYLDRIEKSTPATPTPQAIRMPSSAANVDVDGLNSLLFRPIPKDADESKDT